MSDDTKHRFDIKVTVNTETGCWIWTGSKSRGYGTFRSGGTTVKAYRWSYEYHIGPIPDGLHLDHLCRTPACVNPAHLEPVTNRENMRRTRRALCGKGLHPMTGDNVSIRKVDGCRQCRACRRDWDRQKRARVRAEAKGMVA